MDITRLFPIKLKQDIINPLRDLNLKINPTEVPIPEVNPIMDTVTISDEAKELRYNYQELLEELERLREATEGAKDSSEDFIKCLLIAQRIMSGDRVPLKDEKFLAENQPDLYLRAMLMKTTKVDPKKHKSLIEDEEDTVVSDVINSVETPIPGGKDCPSVDIEISLDMEE